MRPNESDFWNWSQQGDQMVASLNVEAVIENAMANMRRLEEEATLEAVLKFLKERGYTIIGPEDT